MMASALVFIMIPALSLVYSGLGNRSFALTLFRLPMVTASFIGLQWALWGYLVTFTDSILPSNWWGGENRAGVLRNVVAMPVSTGDGPDTSAVIPELVFALYEGMFAAFTAAVVCGGTMHRARPRRFIIFISLWSLLVYDPVARWSWSSKGWLRELGSLDFAGGTPVHIVSGTTVGAFAVFCSIESRGSRSLAGCIGDALRRVWQRVRHFLYGVWSFLRIGILLCSCGRLYVPEGEDPPTEPPKNLGPESFPFNINFVVLGTALLWFGWAGFNGGSALGGNLRAVSAWASTHIAACAGGVTGMLWIWLMKGESMPEDEFGMDDGPTDEAKRNRVMARQAFDRLSVFFFCDGAISGLVAITPAAGYVPVWSAPIFGMVGALCVNFLKKETELLLRHDPLQIFAVHTGGGVVGMVLTAFFVDETTIGLDGHSTIPHPEYSKGQRLGYQLADVASGIGYTFFMTMGILYVMKMVSVLFSGKSWSQTGVDGVMSLYTDAFEASVQQQWRGDVDLEGRPFSKKVIAPTPPPPLSPTDRHPPERPPREDIHMEHLEHFALRNLPSPPRSANSMGQVVPPWNEVPGTHELPPWPTQFATVNRQ
ncbi:putative ammonium transporter [Cladorrhinum sp. PSN332]|nr:putative ammonium transporter [Cladorrhinum sp. PSN332]